MQKIDANLEILIYLLGCVFNGITPERERLAGLDSDRLAAIAKSHNISAPAAKALLPHLDDSGLFTPEQAKQWRTEKHNALRRAVMQEAEKRAVINFLEENQAWYMQMKGSVLQSYYPEFGLREMVDLDILFDERFAEEIHGFMLDKNYECMEFGASNHDVYEKEPVYVFEMHRELFNKKYKELSAYYKNVKERLVRVKDGSCEFAFGKDDFYVFIIAHACKHFRNGGTGLRTLADIYLYLSQEQLNQSYIAEEMEKLSIEEEPLLRGLAELLFSKEAVMNGIALSEKEQALLEYIVSSGTVGSYNHLIENRISRFSAEESERKKSKKLKYIKNRIFVKPEEYKKYYPFFYKHKWARPFLLPVRLFKGATVKRKKVLDEIDIVKKA